jgi:hypothetical protein
MEDKFECLSFITFKPNILLLPMFLFLTSSINICGPPKLRFVPSVVNTNYYDIPPTQTRPVLCFLYWESDLKSKFIPVSAMRGYEWRKSSTYSYTRYIIITRNKMAFRPHKHVQCYILITENHT